MRWLGRLLLYALLVVLSYQGYLISQSFYTETRVDYASPFPHIKSDRRDIYKLPKDHWLSFRLSPDVDRLHVNTIARLIDGNLSIEQYRYSIEYRLTDSDDRVLHQRVYHFKTTAVGEVETNTGDVVPRLYFAEAGSWVGNFQSLFLRTQQWSAATRLSLRLMSTDTEDGVIYAYLRERLSRAEDQTSTTWRRFSEQKKQEVANRYHIYPHYLMSAKEIESLLGNDWRYLGPEGINREDYTAVGLHSVIDFESVFEAQRQSSLSGTVSRNQHLTLPITQHGLVRLGFKSVEDATEPIEVIWHSDASGAASIRFIANPQQDPFWEAEVNPGLLDISTEGHYVIEKLQMPDDWSLQHGRHYQQFLLLEPGDSITFNIDHLDNQRSVIRMDARGFLNDTVSPKTERTWLRGSWTNSSESIQTTRWQVPTTQAVYDRLVNDAPGIAVSIPVSYWYRVSPRVAELTLSANNPVLLRVFSRLDQSSHVQMAPRHSRGWFDVAELGPLWYRIYPKDYRERIRSGRQVLLEQQHRPFRATDSSAGESLTTKVLYPIGESVRMATLYLPVTDSQQLQRTAYSRIFRRIPDGVGYLMFQGNEHERTVTPRVLFTRETNTPFDASIYLDGDLLLQQTLAGSVSAVTLSSVRVGQKTLEIKSPRIRWYINQGPYSSDNLVRYDGFRMDPEESLSFEINKTSDQVLLNLTFYPDQHPVGPSVIEARLDYQPADGENRGYTIPYRRWILNPEENNTSIGFVQNRENQSVLPGTRFFYMLDKDLPPAIYKVRVDLISGTPGYLRVTHQQPTPEIEAEYYREISATE